MPKRPPYDPASDKPFKLSRSGLELLHDCPRCFYLDKRLGVGRPGGLARQLQAAIRDLPVAPAPQRISCLRSGLLGVCQRRCLRRAFRPDGPLPDDGHSLRRRRFLGGGPGDPREALPRRRCAAHGITGVRLVPVRPRRRGTGEAPFERRWPESRSSIASCA
jgi:hypothetical protein